MVERRSERAARLTTSAFVAISLGLCLACSPGEQTAGDVGELEPLRSLGYIEWAPRSAGEPEGVVRRDAARMAPGVNLATSRALGRAELRSAEGGSLRSFRARGDDENWVHAEPVPDGGLVVLIGGRAVARLDADGRERWRTELSAHHDAALDDAGAVYVLESRVHRAGGLRLVDESVTRLSPDGAVERRVWLHPLLANRVARERLDTARGDASPKLSGRLAAVPASADLYHANGLTLLDRDVPGLGRRGDALVTLRELDLLAVVDLEREALRWSWGLGELEAPHAATLTRDGRVLVFDNGSRRRWSRALEVDPTTRRITWEWSGDPPRSLFSARQGAVQALPNGNVLVTESERARAYEVARDGSVVWEFRNPGGRSLQRVTRVERR